MEYVLQNVFVKKLKRELLDKRRIGFFFIRTVFCACGFLCIATKW